MPVPWPNDGLIKHADQALPYIFRGMATSCQHSVCECVHNAVLQLSIITALLCVACRCIEARISARVFAAAAARVSAGRFAGGSYWYGS